MFTAPCSIPPNPSCGYSPQFALAEIDADTTSSRAATSIVLVASTDAAIRWHGGALNQCWHNLPPIKRRKYCAPTRPHSNNTDDWDVIENHQIMIWMLSGRRNTNDHSPNMIMPFCSVDSPFPTGNYTKKSYDGPNYFIIFHRTRARLPRTWPTRTNMDGYSNWILHADIVYNPQESYQRQ